MQPTRRSLPAGHGPRGAGTLRDARDAGAAVRKALAVEGDIPQFELQAVA